MTLERKIADFYLSPGRMTDLGPHAAALHGLPADLPGLGKVVQGLLIHEHWAAAYRQTLTPERRAESQLRSTQQILSQALAKNSEPLTAERPLYQRTVGVCRHFAVLTVALLRRQGIPARALRLRRLLQSGQVRGSLGY